jgi:F-type H+-transporting ATPase subunit gamma
VPSIKDLRKRIVSTKNTQQTTKAMKMVSAAKLRRATDAIMSQRPYANEIAKLMNILSDQAETSPEGAKKPVSMCVVMSSDRGLCGGYNATVIRAATQFVTDCKAKGRLVKMVFVGKKAYELMKSRMQLDVLHYEEFGQKVVFRKATELSKKILPHYESGAVDEVVLVYNLFKNAITQVVQTERVLPLSSNEASKDSGATTESGAQAQTINGMTLFVPSKVELYQSLSGKYFGVQIFKALLESQASEHGARMSAMESATKNAGDMIRKLSLVYNKQRQASITKELLEIIAGSESQKTS